MIMVFYFSIIYIVRLGRVAAGYNDNNDNFVIIVIIIIGQSEFDFRGLAGSGLCSLLLH